MTTPMPTSDDERLNQRLSSFYSVLQAKLKPYRDAKQHLDRFLSTDFNVFKWTIEWIKRKEDFLSDVIADLLDPFGSHGQQSIFLDAFLRRIRKDHLCDKQPRQVTTEYPIEDPEGRLDVLVDFGAFGIAIENKPWAEEGDKQLLRYSDYLSKEYNDQFCLIYLTLSGDKPDSIGRVKRDRLMKEGKLLCISYYTDILEWLRECCQLCESDKLRWFLRDFMNYIPTMEEQMSNLSERRNIGENKMILEHALASEDNLKTALEINSAFNGDLDRRIFVGFLDKLEEFVLDKLRQQLPDASEWEVIVVDLRRSPFDKSTDFSFGKRSWGTQYRVALEPKKDNACDVILGVWREENTPRFQPENLLKQALDRTIGEGNNNNDKGWEWFQHLKDPYRNWGTKDGLIRLKFHEDEAIKHIGEKLVDIIKVAAPIIDEHVQKFS